ncbi:tetratricopeptide (TPR) repeat protein [Silvibacterium bohemicum]|uniref:Tetratricopeptide (TPR) repeat protein n=1 Tax=Silvibacterium bohemicum TaxID=1577686 RepID=A0A841JNF8_9BACT|nr:tetratricopeptide repeat protein [Silvibacterium bohemicum]MBB6142902.1 tetratricopeptide (TPR) repeat protein [Silvibacterium bohemicum]
MSLRFTFALLLLLAGNSFGQQESSLQSILADAQKAQSANDYITATTDYKAAVKIRQDVPELWANLGLMQHESGDYEGAIQSFREANRIRPSLYVPNLFLGIDYVRTGKQKEAVPLLLKAERMNDIDPLPSLTLGRAYSSLGEYRLAAEELQRTIHRDPKQSSAWFALGIVYLHQVEDEARTMTARSPDSPYAKALYAEALVKQDRYKEAEDLYHQVLAAKDQPDCMLSEQGFLEILQNKLEDAARDFQAERSAHPECTIALLGQSRIAVERGSPDEAMRLLQQVWSRNAEFITSHSDALFAGMKQHDRNSFEEFLSQQSGAEEIATALKHTAQGNQPMGNSNDGSSSAPLSLSDAERAFQEGNDAKCVEHLRAGLKSGSSQTLRLLAVCSYFSGNYKLTSDTGAELAKIPVLSSAGLYWSLKANEKLAQDSLAQFEQLEPNSARSHLLMGDIYRQRQLFADAENEYQKALEIAPGDTGAMMGLASAYLGDAKIDQAIAIAERSLAQTPDDLETNTIMGEALIAQHRFAASEPYLLKGLHSKPQMLPHVHALLGKAYAADGKGTDAIRELTLGLASDEDGGLHYQLARLYSKAGDQPAAELAIAQMKAIQQKRRQASVIAVEDSHSSNLDDAP